MRPRRSWITTAAFVAVVAGPTRLTSQPAVPPCGNDTPTPVTDLGERFEYGVEFDPAAQPDFSLTEGTRGGQAPVKYIRTLISVRNPQHGRWYLSVRDGDFHLVETLTADDFATSAARWTARVPGRLMRLDFDNVADAGDVKFVVDEYIVMRDTVRSYYSLQTPGVMNFFPLYCPPQGCGRGIPTHPAITERLKRLGDVVGFLMASDGKAAWACSGVAVASDLFLTNWHCGGPSDGSISDSAYWKTACDSTLIDMSWDDDGLSHEYRCVDVVEKDIERDFALLKVAAVSGSAALRPVIINLTLPVDKRVTVIHHPKAERKRASPNCAVADWEYPSWRNREPAIDFTHRCDTEPGSSGAPVFNGNGEMIGLHHWGFNFNSRTCRYDDHVDKAVRIDKIVEFLQLKQPQIAARLRIAPAR